MWGGSSGGGGLMAPDDRRAGGSGRGFAAPLSCGRGVGTTRASAPRAAGARACGVVVRRDDLAASAGALHAVGADLSCPANPRRPPVSPGVTSPMRITAIRDAVEPISSAIANAYIDFSKMTASVVAIHTDMVRDGRKVVGFGFNSNGRYAVQGLLRERFIPRLLAAAPAGLLDEGGR